MSVIEQTHPTPVATVLAGAHGESGSRSLGVPQVWQDDRRDGATLAEVQRHGRLLRALSLGLRRLHQPRLSFDQARGGASVSS